jgi:hypothetical protein
MATLLQTVHVETDNSSEFLLEKAPICPPSYKSEGNNNFIVMKTNDNSIITWWKSGEIYCWSRNE